MEKVWVSPDCFEVEAYSELGTELPKADAKRALDIWEHARHCLERENLSEFDRSDTIAWLKRALNQRLKLIEQYYSLKKFALPTSPKGYLEYLETLNVVRPFMLKTLMLLRNDIEHKDAVPPTVERCLELLDLVWYFIRSTDELVKNQKYSIVFQKSYNTTEESPYWLSVGLNFSKPYSIKVSGWVESKKYRCEHKAGWLEVTVKDVGTKNQRWPDPKNHSDKNSNDLWVSGELTPLPEEAFNIIRAAINAS
ncbi:hypothetical protein W04_3555 [Pseudoalteromonas sp. SW0106-04]|uniref:hypothetical protein n=1 Tax=Pseudoalteromonas sp. SW0106-04 TaxID=1702169 RepID=UPI0006B3FCD9|nr:hypothetical protein [Pseudoalteromonas sp. SW0106-04]GAP76976.1 hypothetical protein W04_3555 [Pseudoalteromonas sp. SW0106-04]